jgi:hypothetical protein
MKNNAAAQILSYVQLDFTFENFHNKNEPVFNFENTNITHVWSDRVQCFRSEAENGKADVTERRS